MEQDADTFARLELSLGRCLSAAIENHARKPPHGPIADSLVKVGRFRAFVYALGNYGQAAEYQ